MIRFSLIYIEVVYFASMLKLTSNYRGVFGESITFEFGTGKENVETLTFIEYANQIQF